MKPFFEKIKLPILVLCCLIVVCLCLYYFCPMTHLHGTKLLKLPDGKLLKTVHAQNLDIVASCGSEQAALASMSPERRTVYVLSIYEKEMEGGGLCLFFINDTRSVAPYVAEALAAAGAQEHLTLFSQFISDNRIDVHDLGSFAISDIEEYEIQNQRYDFTSFDDAYYAFPLLKHYISSYIRANIDAF